MIRIGRIPKSLGLLALAAWTTMTMPDPAAARPSQPSEPPKPRAMVVSPAAAPIPSLKYRLLPSSADLNPGDAAPIYLRIRHELKEEAWKQLGEKPPGWLQVPLKDFPTAEARQFVDQLQNRGRLQQIEFGARRKTCDWNYSLPEQRRDVVAILLPDAQTMTTWGRLQGLKARTEIAERRYDDAIRSIETGLAFARHVGQGPFLINGLIGIGIATQILGRCEDLIAQPGSPNLYWALTALPRPLVGLRDQMELEAKLFENLIPELGESELARPRSDAEWASFLARLHDALVEWGRFIVEQGEKDTPVAKLVAEGLDGFKSRTLPAAREHWKASHGTTGREPGAISEDRMVAQYLADGYRALWDDYFKNGYLPARIAISQYAASESSRIAAKQGPFILFVAYLPSLQAATCAEIRIDRTVAALRTIEAIRIHAAAHDGALPASLDRVTEVPVPDDPATGRPFEYHLDGNSATLLGPKAGLPPPWPSYRITIRP